MLNTLYDISLAVLFFCWLIITVIRQKANSKIPASDTLDLIPNCRFFAPRPLSHDYRIYVQGIKEFNDTTNWIPLVDFNRNWWNFLWNPKQKLIKTINDMTQKFLRAKKLHPLDFEYLIILNRCTQMFMYEPSVVSVKFIIIQKTGFQNSAANIIFQSKTHHIDRPNIS